MLANPFENVQEEELALAVTRANSMARRPSRVFARDTSEWGYHLGPPNGSAVDMIDAFAQLPAQRSGILETARWGADASMLKGAAALAKDPLLPLTLAMQHHLDTRRATFRDYGRGLSASEVIMRSGGKGGFPGYQAQESLVAERLKDAGQKSTANDLLDEYVAFYAPYAAVTVLDKRTLHRAKMAKLPHLARMTRYLSEVEPILERVRSGELVPIESTF